MSLRYASMSSVELLGLAEGLTQEWCDVRDTSGDPLYQRMIREHLTPLERELARRTERANADQGPNPRAGWITDLAGLAVDLRRAGDIRYPLSLHGWQPVRVSSVGEAAGPCPFCGGHDRFVVWPASSERDGRAWCRRCRWVGDVIALYRDLEGVTFVRALEDLAAASGVTVPRVSDTDAASVLGNARHVLQVAS